MRQLFLFFGIIFSSFSITGQEAYQFTDVIDLEATPVISQGRTGTCWSFSTSSFLESEIIRLTGKEIDLSEMYTVRNTYPKKAENFVMRQGKAQFSEGGLAHDVLNSVREYGLVPNEAFSGLFANQSSHNHAEMVAVIKSMLETYVDNPGRKLSKKWTKAVDAVLDIYLGANVNSFTFEGKSYTPQSFLEMTKINPDEYVNITSFTHAGYYSSKDGVAVIPSNSINNKKALQGIYPEKKITQDFRQDEFENFTTTDDHLMHITGMVKDQNGTVYYKVKNSWGTDPDRTTHNGYVYFSEAYMRLKAISITLHKDGLTKKTAQNLKL